MDHLSSPLEGSTHVCFSRGGGVSHRIAGGKPPPEEIQAGDFPQSGAFGIVLLSPSGSRRFVQKYKRGRERVMI